MANVTAYIEYSLLNSGGLGYQPYSQIENSGMTFEGGVLHHNGRYLGYLYGDSRLIDATVASLGAWSAIRLTAEEAKMFMEMAAPTNTQVIVDGATKYLGGPTLDGEGKLTRALLDAASGTPAPYVERRTTTLYMQDDFLAGNTTSGSIGSLGWTTQNGVNSIVTASLGRAGIVARATGNTANTVAGMILLPTAGTGLNVVDRFSLLFIIRLAQVDANTTIRVGLTDSGAGTLQPPNGIYFERLNTDANWFGVTRASSSQTRVNTNVEANTSFVKLYIRRIDNNTIGFKVDNSVEVTLTTNIPALALNPWLVITNTASGSKLVELDYFDIRIDGLPR